MNELFLNFKQRIDPNRLRYKKLQRTKIHIRIKHTCLALRGRPGPLLVSNTCSSTLAFFDLTSSSPFRIFGGLPRFFLTI
ncbi:hypothetical protein BpHYR1_053018 [Brachionus plicatilis]|uniref:Uncharacterized protein n=1 Tax=Brachionus plicatilis TaxID=10195 RepID=A0A3M7SA51_BRAPC|nr:hypothetical protein BpHYR1_053018 [Brachionus plicatilis]